MRWVWRGSALAALLIGWVFIAWQNRFHVTAPVVFVCIGYLAVIATVYNLWRTGAAAVASPEDDDDSTWAKPAGALGELEREKRTLLKAIKEAEFDHQMGKLSQRDVDDMIRTYRARAIEVIKEIERLELGAAGSTREQILREVRARLELEAKSPKKAAEPNLGAKPDSGDAKGKKKKPPGKDVVAVAVAAAAAVTEPAAAASEPAAAASEGADTRSAESDGAAAKPTAASAATEPTERVDGAGAAEVADAAVAHAGDAANHTAAAAAAKLAAQAAVQMEDDAMNADSTTTVEPKREDRAKEATP